MDKNSAKALAFSILAVAKVIFSTSKKATFVIDVLTQLVMDRFDEAMKVYFNTARGKYAANYGPDPADDLILGMSFAMDASQGLQSDTSQTPQETGGDGKQGASPTDSRDVQ